MKITNSAMEEHVVGINEVNHTSLSITFLVWTNNCSQSLSRLVDHRFSE